MTQTVAPVPTQDARDSIGVRAWAPAGIGAALLAYSGVHLMHPPGAPEHLTDAQVIAWVRPAAGQIWAGGSFSLLAALLLVAFAEGWATQIRTWNAPPWVAQIARQSITITATVIALTGILQISAAVSTLPSENVTEPSLTATLFNLYGNIAVSAWVLILPAVTAGILTRRPRPRWVLIVSVIAILVLVPTLALPPLGWALGPAWLIAISVGCLLTPRPIDTST